jgi:alkylation response protein AidB-like acyl-CoA dehydrogenase
LEAAPRLATWEAQGRADRAFWRLAGEQGLLGYVIPQQYGGLGGDRRYGAILREEMARIGIGGTGLGIPLHADVIAPFIIRHGTEEQKQRWLPRMVTGEVIAALAMTERAAGSDSKNILTNARRVSDEWMINGSKIFITNGSQADLLILAVRTDGVPGAKGISLLLVETDRPGCSRSGPMLKTGLKYEDAAELFFDNVHVPLSALLGEAGAGFSYLMHGMAWERMQIALMAIAVCENVLEWTLRHVRQRQAFEKTLFDLQNTRFKLAECVAETRIGRQFVDRCLELECAGQLDPVDAATAKYWCTELQGRVVDQCVQLHGGWGVIAEHPVARAYVDARVTRIYGGANEVLREIIARSL